MGVFAEVLDQMKETGRLPEVGVSAAASMTNRLQAGMIAAEGELGWRMVVREEVVLEIERAIDWTFELTARVGGGFRSRL